MVALFALQGNTRYNGHVADSNYPKLRYVEAIPAQDGMICLRDPLGFSDKMLLLPIDVYFICSLFDGKHSILDIQTEYARKFGNLLFEARAREIIEQLDSCLFLDSRRFAEARTEALESFRKSPLRKASHAGAAYEVDPEKLRLQLRGFFAPPEGPGLPLQEGHGLPPQESPGRPPQVPPRTDLPRPDLPGANPPSGKLRGLIAPHIDLRRGGPCYAWSYAELARECTARTFVVLGISHIGTQRRYVLTDKDFETPLGTVPANRELIEAISSRCRIDFSVDEFTHRQEHSIEFQALFLQYLFAGREDISIVPILCSSLNSIILAGNSPVEDPEAGNFIDALKEAVSRYDREVCVIAGVDLSHVGQRFGQDLALSPNLLAKLEEDDRNMMQNVVDLDAEGFVDFIRQEKDRRNVCGVPAIYTLLKLIDSQSARMLRYDQAAEEATQSVVTFTAAAFYG